MHLDVLDLKAFYYRSMLGRTAQTAVRNRLLELWPEAKGQTVAGFGFAVPLLRPYLPQARRVIGLMPGPQGVMAPSPLAVQASGQSRGGLVAGRVAATAPQNQSRPRFAPWPRATVQATGYAPQFAPCAPASSGNKKPLDRAHQGAFILPIPKYSKPL